MGNQVCLDLRNSSSVLLTIFTCVYKGMLEIHTPELVCVCVCVMDIYIMYINRNHVPPGGWTLL